MKTLRWICFSLALGMILSGGGFLLYLKHHQRLGLPGVKVGPVPLLDAEGKTVALQSVLLPAELPGLKSRPLPISKNELSMLPRDTTFGRRLYEASDGFAAVLNVVLMGSDRTSIHKPEFCLPSQGWTISKQEQIAIPIPSSPGASIPAMKWTIRQVGRDNSGHPIQLSGLYIFWFVSQNEITAQHGQRVFSIVKHLLRKGELERWAYVAYYSICNPGQEEATSQKLEQFVSRSVPEFQTTRVPVGTVLPASGRNDH